MDALIVFCAKYLVVAPLGAALAYVRKSGATLVYEILLALPLAYILARVLGLFYYHEQPFAVYEFEPLLPHAIDNSFPSDHMVFASVFAASLYLRHRWVGLSVWIIAGVIGIARVAAGLHYPVDIVAAALVATAAVYAAGYVVSSFFQRKKSLGR